MDEIVTIPASPQQSETTYRTTRDLTAAQRRLLQIMREHRFGRVENMRVQAGQPVLDASLKIVRVVRLGAEGSPTHFPIGDEFELKQCVLDLFEELTTLRNGTIVKLEFRHGLPCLLETMPSE